MQKLPLTYCNPLCIEDIPLGRRDDCRLTKDDIRSIPDYRSISDPSVVYAEGKWIMYPSYNVAYVSEDFVHWKHVDIGINHLLYSPEIACFHGKWYMLEYGSDRMCVSDSPTGPFTECGHLTDPQGKSVIPLDGCMLADGDHLYVYWHVNPSQEKLRRGEYRLACTLSEDVEYLTATAGAELDPEKPWQMLDTPVILNCFDPKCEWQRTGNDNQNCRMGWIEGQWAIRRGNRWYLMCSGSGTQYASYANGVWISEEGPLSGFHPQKNHDPLSRKTWGLVRGAGHGSIAEGPGGTLWLFYTCIFCYNHLYERRVAMDPLGIDEDGELYCPALTETPQFAPGVLPQPEKGNDAGLLPLTFLMRPKATSSAPGRDAIYASDDSVLTWWQPAEGDSAPTITFSLGKQSAYHVQAFRLIWRDIGMESLDGILPGPFRYVIEYADVPDCSAWQTLVDASDNTHDLCIDYRTFAPVRAYAVRLRILGAPAGITPGLVSLTAFGICAPSEE